MVDEFVNIFPNKVKLHLYIIINQQLYHFFKNTTGVINDTHIPTIISQGLQNGYGNMKGFTSQNVMAKVSFNQQFIYTNFDWEQSVEGMRAL